MLMFANSVLQARSESDAESRLLPYEQRHFSDCLAFAFNAEHWISYTGALYFMPRTEQAVQEIEKLKGERAAYLVFTNVEARYQFAARALAESDVGGAWQTNMLVPWSVTNQNLLPILDKPLRVVGPYKLLQDLGEGDVLLRQSNSIYFVMEYRPGVDDAGRTNAFLVKEGTRTYRTVSGNSKTVEAFTYVNLSREQLATLHRVEAFFQHKSMALAEELAQLKLKEEFQTHKARAIETEPFVEYTVAQDYLQGRGTEKDESLGLEWMRKAARDGSGDAEAYLETLKAKGK